MTALEILWQHAALPRIAPGSVVLTGNDPILPSSFRVGTAAQATIAAAGLAAAEIWRRRSGQSQTVTVDMRHAAAEFRSERYLRIDGQAPSDPWDAIAGAYRCGDGRYVRLHTNFPHHRDGVLRILGCAYNREAVAAALKTWDAEAFETRATAEGLVVAAMRSFSEWDAHPHGMVINATPPLTVERIGDAPPTPLPRGGDRPLSGVRALDLTRVIAGPVCGRALAAHGAEVLHISGPHLPALGERDTGRGKRSAHVDLRDPAGHDHFRQLLAGADLFVQSYRPGALAAAGFGFEQAAAIRPGLVCVTLSAYGETGPWAGKRGFDSLVQTATGLNHAEGEAAGTSGEPKVLPCQTIDHASGYLLALGAMATLLRRADEGGSWLVRVSLAATGRWLRGLGRLEHGLAAPDQSVDDVQDLLETTDSGFGRMTGVRHAAQLSATPARWAFPAVPLGTHPAAWLAS